MCEQDFFLNNQPDALIIQTYSVVKLHPDSAWKRSSKTSMKLTSAEDTVENPWLWAQKMPETC